MIQIFFTIIRIAILVFILFCLFLFFFQESMIFFTSPLRHSPAKFAENRLEIDHQGVMLRGWFLPAADPANAPLIIYYGGNAEEVSANLEDHGLFGRDISLALINYRGYGESDGKPSQQALFKDALFVYDYLTTQQKINPDQTVVMGRSLGSGVAVHVASQRPVQRVILVTPFDSLTNVAGYHYPLVPIRLLLRHPFDSVSLAPTLTQPLLVLMAGQDTVVPNRFTKNLIDQWAGPKEMVNIPEAGHNDITAFPQYWQAMDLFLSPMK